MANPGSALSITRSVIAGNDATTGGRLYMAMGGTADVTLSNDTVSGNTASATAVTSAVWADR
ncbi:MAG: hypothetical protein K0V04_04005 [Deltaproteobacteria bacterium]|nr:hypothetical protein [Deltaproteobacteria bacterium]